MKRQEMSPRQPRRLIVLALSAAFAPAFAAERIVETATIEVVGNSPLAGIGIPRQQVPANVQSVSERQLEEQESLNLPEFMARRLPSVNVNEIQGNPFQQDVNYRGFTASPLLGTAQGLSVYLDGVRINAPFGDRRYGSGTRLQPGLRPEHPGWRTGHPDQERLQPPGKQVRIVRRQFRAPQPGTGARRQRRYAGLVCRRRCLQRRRLA